MKKYILPLCFIFTCSLYGQWVYQTQINQRFSLRNIFSVDTSHSWAVGDTGMIVFSRDKALTWFPQQSGIKDQLLGVYFLDTSHGFAYGINGTLLATNNGGNIWTKDTTHFPNGSVRSMTFADKNNGWLVVTGTPPALYRTRNGGKTWQEQMLPGTVTTSLLKVQFVDTSNGWMLSLKKIYRTTNGGIDWTIFDNNGNIYTTFRDVQFISRRTGYFLIDQYFKVHLGRTNDGGESWDIDSSFTPVGSSSTFFFHFKDSLFGCAAASSFIGITTDGGMNWNVTKRSSLTSVCIINDKYIAAVGNLGTKLYSTDRGSTWIDLTPPTPMTLRMVKYQSPFRMWAVGGTSTLLQSTDQGTNWKKIGIPSGIGINGMAFPDTTHGWVLDDSARIFLTTDFGNSWIKQTTGLTKGLRSISFADSLIGCTVGDNGVTLTTMNGGIQWNPVTNISTQTLYDIFFVNKNAGWAVGKLGTIVRAYNSGTVWKLQTSPTTVTLRSISFSDTLQGTIVGDSGVVLRTVNGGDVWQKMPIGNTLNYRSVKMIDQKGWIVGDSGRIYSSINRGENWELQQSNTTSSLFGVDFVNQNLGSIVGEGTTILVTKNGGTAFVRNDGSAQRNISFSLDYNFPNPFNPSTTINYAIEQSGMVTIDIFNSIGQYIETILRETKDKGSYSIKWVPQNLPSGMYYYRIDVNGNSLTRKMVFLK